MSNKNKKEKRASQIHWEERKKEFYGTTTVMLIGSGYIDFDPDGLESLVGNDGISYDEYLDLQWKACIGNFSVRWSFARCCLEMDAKFSGKIEKITSRAVCFRQIAVSGFCFDGDCFSGKEDHVWIDKQGLEGYKVGDSLSFFANVFRYVKTGQGKQIDYGLCNLRDIEVIPHYELPTDEELMLEAMDSLICETCMFREQCYQNLCLRNENEVQYLRMAMLQEMKKSKGEIEDDMP